MYCCEVLCILVVKFIYKVLFLLGFELVRFKVLFIFVFIVFFIFDLILVFVVFFGFFDFLYLNVVFVILFEIVYVVIGGMFMDVKRVVFFIVIVGLRICFLIFLKL